MSGLSAWGKIILFGEHAAVYGHPALAVGIPDGIRPVALVATEGPIRLRVEPWSLSADQATPGLLGDCLRRLDRLVPGRRIGMQVALESTIPPSAGLGSSAALSVALVRCLDRIRAAGLDDEQVRAAAHQLEAIFHGQPSGLDDTLATYGGVCLFCRDGVAGLAPDDLAPLTRQAARLRWPVPSLVVADTGVKHSTADLVAGVRRQRERDPDGVARLFSRIDRCLEDGLSALRRRDPQGLGEAMGRNQAVLAELDLSCAEIDELVALAARAGACGAKLTGAGGGGGVVAVAPGRESALLEAWRGAGYRAWLVHPSGAGEYA